MFVDRSRKHKVVQAFIRNRVLEVDARRIEQEHQSRKAQIDNFFDNLKKKAVVEEEQKQEEIKDSAQKAVLKKKLRDTKNAVEHTLKADVLLEMVSPDKVIEEVHELSDSEDFYTNS